MEPMLESVCLYNKIKIIKLVIIDKRGILMLSKKVIISVFIVVCMTLALSACDHNESSDQTNLYDSPDNTQKEQTTPDLTVYESEIDVEYQPDIEYGSDVEIIERIHHIVAENETLEDIANIHHTTIEILKQINWFLEDDHLPVGLQLRIPHYGFQLQQDIKINISEINTDQIDHFDADIIFDFEATGVTLLIEIDPNVQDIKVFLQDLSTGPRKPHVTPVIGYIRPNSNPGQIILLNYDNISTQNAGIKFTDDDGMERYFVIGWPMPEWTIFDFTVEFWNMLD